MGETTYRGRRAYQIENGQVRVTVLQEGGHIAEILHKETGVNPLWIPPWPSIEPSAYDRATHPEYGDDAESKLLAGIMGHNLCLDLFGAPSPEEAAAGMTVHGEASVEPYTIATDAQRLAQSCDLPQAGLQFSRTIALHGNVLTIAESVENRRALDRPIAWTEHVTLGPPFLERGSTAFRAPVAKSYSLDADAEFAWPTAPHNGDLRVYTGAPESGGFTTHLMDPQRERAFFLAYSPASKVLLGYVWKRADFPWLGIWRENRSRKQPPWNGETLTQGMEFGASPLPESRRAMIDRKNMFDAPGYRWAPAQSVLRVRYHAFVATADRIPERLEDLPIALPD